MASQNIILSDKNAFYNLPKYEETTKSEFAQPKALDEVTYSVRIENRVWAATKNILTVLIPIGILCLAYLYKVDSKGWRAFKKMAPALATLALLRPILHLLSGKIIVWASTYRNDKDTLANRTALLEKVKTRGSAASQEWCLKRITVEVDGVKLDAALIGNATTFNNGRWLLYSNGNGTTYEDVLLDDNLRPILAGTDCNALVFNYPNVLCSKGFATQSSLINAYRGMLTFLEDSKKGIGATEIIGYGHSLGGGVQGSALEKHKLKKDIKYLFVKDRSFSTLYSAISHMPGVRYLAKLAWLIGWNMGSVTSSTKLQTTEVIIQTTNNKDGSISSSEDVAHDGVIAAEASLAKRLLEKGQHDNKHFFGPEAPYIIDNYFHVAPLSKTHKQHLAKIINDTFS